MSDGYTRRPFLLKGALVEFSERFLGPVPNIIVFQYNPESLTRTLEPYIPLEQRERETPEAGTSDSASTAQPHDPPETFNLTLLLDASDALEDPDNHPVAVATGVADRIAAIELLTYPQDAQSLVGNLLTPLFGGGIDVRAARRDEVSIVFLVFGPRLIVPVRLTSFSVNEKLFSPLLYPIQAEVTVGLKILTDAEIGSYSNVSSFVKDLAKAAYVLTKTQKKALAAANLANSVESILSLLPF